MNDVLTQDQVEQGAKVLDDGGELWGVALETARKLVRWFAGTLWQIQYLRLREMAQMFGTTVDACRCATKALVRVGAIQVTGRGFRMATHFHDFVRIWETRDWWTEK